MKRILCLILSLCLALCGCAKQEQSRDTVSLWYVQGQEPAGLEKLVNEYNESLSASLLKVTLRSFPHEQALAAAFDMRPPDLMLCYHTKAAQLCDQGRLRDCAAADLQYAEGIEQSLAFAGKSYFPLGVQVQLLAEAEAVFGDDELRDLESFCTAAKEYSLRKGRPAFTADDFSQLFSHALVSLDTEFHADIGMDKNGDIFKYVYNLLAETAMEGGMLATEYSAVDILLNEQLPYALTLSTELVKASDKLSARPEPTFRNSLKYPGLCIGFAVTAGEGRSLKSVENFLNYVNQTGRNSSLALGAGLVPALPDMQQRETSLENCLMEIGAFYELYLPSADSDYMKNRLRFEAVFRNTVNRLY